MNLDTLFLGVDLLYVLAALLGIALLLVLILEQLRRNETKKSDRK